MQVHKNQVLFTLKTHADQDWMKCASACLVINWVKYEKITREEDEYEHRERIIGWSLKEAGISKRFWPAESKENNPTRFAHT